MFSAQPSRAISSAILNYWIGLDRPEGARFAQVTGDTFGSDLVGFVYLSWVPNAMYYQF